MLLSKERRSGVKRSKTERRRLRNGLLFIAPWIVGFLTLSLYPLISSFAYSLTDYSVLSEPVYVGVENYQRLAGDALFWQSLYNTLYFAAFSIPASLSVALTFAILLNFDLPGRSFFRTIYFLPSLLPLVCLGVLWQWLLNGDIGLINVVLGSFYDFFNGLFGTDARPPNWLADPAFTKPALILTTVWTAGNAVVIFMAGLQDVPRQLYEAAEIDGANFFQKLWHITLPMISPVIYFNGIMALIGSLQVFALPFIITGGSDGPGRSLMFTATYIYRRAFEYWDMGYASAIGLVLFLVVLLLTLVAHKASKRYTYYQAD